uniref:Circumsporozoite protein-like n=1 Tax=Oryza sativa subsp. japonica TaxID=39947 RepID=Q6YUY5_ORYSJ|nr:circumsporozoite protein-like [Oryza sativa Japonica Group]BAD16435.1 circumsporozoite protein-like [Oryza sativa Japonica Group]
MRRAHAQPHGLRWNARTGGADRGRPDPISAELAPTWRLRGCHAGWREGGNVGLETDFGRSRRELALGARVQIGDRAEEG